MSKKQMCWSFFRQEIKNVSVTIRKRYNQEYLKCVQLGGRPRSKVDIANV